jgi:thymidine kinase
MFRKYSYTVIFGPSNAGKTSYFLNLKHQNKFKNLLLVSVLDLIQLLPRLDVDYYFNYIKLIDIPDNIDYETETIICVDEIHFFDEIHLNLLDEFLRKFKKIDLYFTMISQSHMNTLLNNTIELLSNANDIKIIKGICDICTKKTIQSVCLELSNKNTHLCGKSLFSARCKNCKNSLIIED